jgi:hypothetical protein
MGIVARAYEGGFSGMGWEEHPGCGRNWDERSTHCLRGLLTIERTVHVCLGLSMLKQSRVWKYVWFMIIALVLIFCGMPSNSSMHACMHERALTKGRQSLLTAITSRSSLST